MKLLSLKSIFSRGKSGNYNFSDNDEELSSKAAAMQVIKRKFHRTISSKTKPF